MRTKIIVALLASLAFTAPAYAQSPKATLNALTSSDFPDNTVGSITPQVMRNYMGTIISSFQQWAGVNAQTGVTYTVASTDYGQLVTLNNAAPVAVTLPAASSLIPFSTYLQNLGAGIATITPASGNINGAGSFTLAQNQGVFVVSDGTNWQTFGRTSQSATFPATGTSGAVPYFNSTTTIATSALLAANGVVIGGGAGTAPSTITACTAGQLIYGTASAPVCQTPASTTSTPANPTAFAPGTAAYVMVGLAGAITPVGSGRIYVSITGNALVGSTTNAALIACRFGTGAAPANQAAVTGTQIGNPVEYLAAGTTQVSPFACGGVITGNTLATALWLDLAVKNITGSQTITLTNITVAAYEF